MRTFYKLTTKLGFTLIELLVSITILLLITGGAMAAFSTFSDNRKVEETAKQVQQLFVAAQQKAAVKETPQQCITDGASLQGYMVKLTANSAFLVALCGSALSEYPLDLTKSYTFESGVSTTTTTSQIFYTLQQGTDNKVSIREYIFNGSNVSYKFTVSPGGTISSVTK